MVELVVMLREGRRGMQRIEWGEREPESWRWWPENFYRRLLERATQCPSRPILGEEESGVVFSFSDVGRKYNVPLESVVNNMKDLETFKDWLSGLMGGDEVMKKEEDRFVMALWLFSQQLLRDGVEWKGIGWRLRMMLGARQVQRGDFRIDSVVINGEIDIVLLGMVLLTALGWDSKWFLLDGVGMQYWQNVRNVLRSCPSEVLQELAARLSEFYVLSIIFNNNIRRMREEYNEKFAVSIDDSLVVLGALIMSVVGEQQKRGVVAGMHKLGELIHKSWEKVSAIRKQGEAGEIDIRWMWMSRGELVFWDVVRQKMEEKFRLSAVSVFNEDIKHVIYELGIRYHLRRGERIPDVATLYHAVVLFEAVMRRIDSNALRMLLGWVQVVWYLSLLRELLGEDKEEITKVLSEAMMMNVTSSALGWLRRRWRIMRYLIGVNYEREK